MQSPGRRVSSPAERDRTHPGHRWPAQVALVLVELDRRLWVGVRRILWCQQRVSLPGSRPCVRSRSWTVRPARTQNDRRGTHERREASRHEQPRPSLGSRRRRSLAVTALGTTLRRARASRAAEAARGRRPNVAARLVGVGVLFFALAPSTAIAARTRPTASAADTSALSNFAPTLHCRGGGSPSLSGTGLDGTDLELTVRHTGHGADTIEHVALKGTLHFTFDAQLAGSVQCEASALAPVPDLPGVRVGPDFSLNTTGAVDGDFTWAPSIDVSFDVSRDGFTHRVMQFANHSGVVFSGNGTAHLDLLLEAKAGTRVGDPLQAGLTATVGPEITAMASASTADHSLCWSVTGRASASLHAFFRVWHWLEANKTWSWQSRRFGFAPQCTTTAAPSPQPTAPSAPVGAGNSVMLRCRTRG
jgi:hypothetical protein